MKGFFAFVSPYQRVVLLVALVVVLILGTLQPLQAATCTWTGAVSSDWHTAGNWSCGVVPGAADAVIVPDVVNDPVLAADGAAQYLNAQEGATITIDAGRRLVLGGSAGGNLTGSGNIFGVVTIAPNAVGLDFTANYSGVVESLVVSMGSANQSLILTQDLQVGDFNLNAIADIATSAIVATGTITVNDLSYTHIGAGSTIRLAGTGDQTITGTGNLHSLEVSNGGNVLAPNGLRFGGSAVGSKLTGSSNILGAVTIAPSAVGADFTANYSGVIDSVVVSMGSANQDLILTQDLQVGDFTLNAIAGIATSDIVATGTITVNDLSYTHTGAGSTIRLAGTGDQTITGTGNLHSLDASNGGNVLAPNGLRFGGSAVGSKLTGSSNILGAVTIAPSAVGADFTANYSGVIDSVVVSMGSANQSLILTQDLQVGNFTLNAIGDIATSDIVATGAITVNDLSYTHTGAGSTIRLAGTGDQTVTGTGKPVNFDIAKPSGDVLIDTGFNRNFNQITVSVGAWDVLSNVITATNGFVAQGGAITGAGTLNGNLSITSGGSLGGAVTVNGNVTANNTGILAAGNSPGQVTVNGNLSLNSGSILDVDINGSTPGTEHDQWVVNGTVTINDAVLTGTVGGPLTTPITVIANNATDAIVGTRFNGAATNGGTVVIDGVTYLIYYQGDTGNDLVLEELRLPPSAGDDDYIALGDTTLTVVAGAGLLANDTDADSLVLTATVQTTPQNGTISLQADGSFVYTPTTGFLGTDVFTYTVSDGVLSDDGLVSIKVLRDSTTAIQVSLPITGWNLFGYPLQRTLPVTEALSSIDGKYDRVFGYESADPSSPWKMYDPTLQAPFDSLLNELTEMVFAQGYWLRTTEPVTLTLPGDNAARLAADASTLRALPPATLYGYLPSNPYAGQPIEAWIGATRCGLGVTQAMDDGRVAFAVHVSAADSSTPSCGTVGRAVTLKVAGAEVLISTWDNDQAGFVDFTPQFTQPIYLPLVGKE